MKEHQIKELADQNDTSARAAKAITHNTPAIQEGGHSGGSSNIVGHVVSGAGCVARGVLNFVNPFHDYGASSSPDSPGEQHHSLNTQPRKASPVPQRIDEEVSEYESEQLSDEYERMSNRSRKTESMAGSARSHLSEIHQQQ